MTEFKIPRIEYYPKECPFCHNTPTIAKDKLWSGNGHGYYGCYEYYVACKNDKCKVRPRTKPYDDIYDMTEEQCVNQAIADWNDR